jgi:hypothetical protein
MAQAVFLSKTGEGTGMRRRDREITDISVMESIIRGSSVCRMGLCDGGRPYVVPMNFGYRDGKVFMHSAMEGEKLDIIRKNPDVCLVFETDLEIVRAEEACSFSMKYRSVIARGRASIQEEAADKAYGLNVIMDHYTGKEFEFPAQVLQRIVVITVDIEEMTGKQNV